MISELIQVADRWASGRLTGQEPHRQRFVHWFVDLDSKGNVLGFSPTAGQEEKKAKRFALPANYRLGSAVQTNSTGCRTFSAARRMKSSGMACRARTPRATR
jgi:hypothetical protein